MYPWLMLPMMLLAADLPVAEVPVAGMHEAARDDFVLIMTGDGGWAALDRSIAQAFASRGIPVVGLNSLRYFWNARTPEETARDVAGMISHYQALWHRKGVHLIGYSFGADVLPFVVNRLPDRERAQVRSVTLISPSQSATFEVHVADWLPGHLTPGLPLRPEVERLSEAPLCIYGAGEDDTYCPILEPGNSFQIGNGHRLGVDGGAVADRILGFHLAGAGDE